MSTMKYEALIGSHVRHVIREMIDLAVMHNTTVESKFNDDIITVNPDSNEDEVYTAFHERLEEKTQAYRQSDAYKTEAENRKRERQRNDTILESQLSSAPPMTFSSDEAKEKWMNIKANNTDSYGSRIMKYAEDWARLMEKHISRDIIVADCAEQMSRIADNDGITGYMYGCAVQILSDTWAHGEILRRWHNLDTQIRDEGERANREGRVLNPALMTINIDKKK